MKTVLCPVDFSDASANALLFAGDLARRASARLLIVNILDDRDNEEESQAKLRQLETELRNSFGSDLQFESSIAHGNFVNSMKAIVETQRPDLVIMGTKGASGLKRILIGSNTVNVIANTDVPVLVIPEVARFEYFLNTGKNRVVLATDLEALQNDSALDVLKNIASLILHPKLRVLSVRPENTDLSFDKRMERSALLSIFSPEIESDRATVFSSNVMRGINFYLKEHDDTGLVAMIARDSGHLIQKHYTREMASHTHLPLLVLHDAKSQ